MHLVHYDSMYANVSDAQNHTDGLAVVGVFMKVLLSPPRSQCFASGKALIQETID